MKSGQCGILVWTSNIKFLKSKLLGQFFLSDLAIFWKCNDRNNEATIPLSVVISTALIITSLTDKIDCLSRSVNGEQPPLLRLRLLTVRLLELAPIVPHTTSMDNWVSPLHAHTQSCTVCCFKPLSLWAETGNFFSYLQETINQCSTALTSRIHFLLIIYDPAG